MVAPEPAEAGEHAVAPAVGATPPPVDDVAVAATDPELTGAAPETPNAGETVETVETVDATETAETAEVSASSKPVVTWDEPDELGSVAAERPSVRRTERPAKRSAIEVYAVRAIVVVAAAAAALAPGAPTGHHYIDALWCAALGAAVTFAASRSRRWAWLWSTGVVALASIGDIWVVPAGLALALAVAGMFLSMRNRVVGAAVGALAGQALLRLPSVGFHGASALLAVVAVAPLFWSAYERSSPRLRRRARLVLFGVVGLAAVATVAFAMALAAARGHLDNGIDSAQAGVDLLRDGEQDGGAVRLEQAADEFDAARAILGGVWTVPAQAVPVVAQHRDAAAAVAASGYDLAVTGATAASTAPYQDLKASKGRIDLATVVRMQRPASDAAAALRQAARDTRDVDSAWLLPPMAGPLADFRQQIDDALPEAEIAELGLEAAPRLLGGDGARRYLVLFTNPAETRFVGGFTGSYGVLTADKGQVEFDVGGRINEMLTSDPASRSIEGHDDYLLRYGRYEPAKFLQNLTASPDFPTDAAIARDLYEKDLGQHIDGVMLVDPYAIAALLQLTGPVDVEGLPMQLTGENAAEFLIYGQYVDYGDERSERKDVLEAAGRATFSALTSRDLPGPRQIGKLLGPMVEQNRLLMHSFATADQPLFERLHTPGRFSPDLASDFLSVRTANMNPNKIDSKLQRSIRYDATYDPGTGSVTATATVTLENSAPPSGLPPYLIGNDRGLPDGSNTMYLSFYSPLEAAGATIDGAPVGIEVQTEAGANVFSFVVSVDAGGTRTLVIDLHGVLPSRAEYRLQILNQPVVNPDRVTVRVLDASKEWRLLQGRDLTVQGTAAIGEFTMTAADWRVGADYGG